MSPDPQPYFDLVKSGGSVLVATVCLTVLLLMVAWWGHKYIWSPSQRLTRDIAKLNSEAANSHRQAADANAEAAKYNARTSEANERTAAHLDKVSEVLITAITKAAA